MNDESRAWNGFWGAVVVCVIVICITLGLRHEVSEQTKREIEKTLQMQEQTRQLELQLQKKKE